MEMIDFKDSYVQKCVETHGLNDDQQALLHKLFNIADNINDKDKFEFMSFVINVCNKELKGNQTFSADLARVINSVLKLYLSYSK